MDDVSVWVCVCGTADVVRYLCSCTYCVLLRCKAAGLPRLVCLCFALKGKLPILPPLVSLCLAAQGCRTDCEPSVQVGMRARARRECTNGFGVRAGGGGTTNFVRFGGVSGPLLDVIQVCV